MNWIIIATLLPLALYLAVAGIYQLVLALAAQTASHEVCTPTEKQNKFLVLVPAYQEDAVILKSTQKNLALKYEYHRDLFDYVVIADGLKTETVSLLKQMGACVHTVNFEKSTKAKSLQSAMKQYGHGYDAVVVLDADNVVNLSFLRKANMYLNQGYCAIQGQRRAANSQSLMAILDGFSEAANTAMLCQGANRLGLSSKLSGSGMVFTYDLFKTVISELTAIGGFDKEMELKLTSSNIYIKYAQDLVVTDEKVASYEAYAKQRGRWLESQYSFLKKSFKPALRSLLNGNRDYFHKTVQLALPPRALAPFALAILLLAGLLLSQSLVVLASIGLVSNLASYLITIPRRPLFKHSWSILKAMPKLLASTLNALQWMKQSKREFLHTKHELAQS